MSNWASWVVAMLLHQKLEDQSDNMFCIICVGIVPPFGLFLPLLSWLDQTMERMEKPDPKLPLKAIVSASGKELFDKGRAWFAISEAKAKEAEIEAGPYQVLMVARAPPYDEAQEQHMLLKGEWIERARNARPIDGGAIVDYSIGFEFNIFCPLKDGSDLRIETTVTDIDNKDPQLFWQYFDWTADDEAWTCTGAPMTHVHKSPHPALLENSAYKGRGALPPSARLRMVHPNVIEVYLPFQRAGEPLGKVVISYMFRKSEYFEPVYDETRTLGKYQAWLGRGAEEDPNLLVWLGTSDAPIAPPRPLAADGAGIDATQVLREWMKAQDIFNFAEHMPFINELALYRSRKLWLKVQTQMPFLVETIFEALPQSLLQTSAMVIFSEGSPEDITSFQLASVGISVMSLLTKIYAACDSMVPQMFFFKGACLCFDLVCLFYTFTVLFAAQRDDPDAVQVFFLTRPVDWASAIYVWIVAGEVIAFWVASGSLWIAVMIQATIDGDGVAFSMCSIGTLAGICAFFPVGLLAMSIRISWAVAMVYYMEQRFSTNYRFYRQAYAFVHSGADVHARIKAVNHALLGEDTAGHGTMSLVSVTKVFRGTIREITSDMMGEGESMRKRYLTVCAWVAAVLAGLAALYTMVYPHLTFGLAIKKSMATGRPLNPVSLCLYVLLSLCFLLAVAFSPVAWRFLRFAILVHAVDEPEPMASPDEKLQEVREVYMEHYETTSPQQQQQQQQQKEKEKEKEEEEEEEKEEEEQQQQQEQAPTVMGTQPAPVTSISL